MKLFHLFLATSVLPFCAGQSAEPPRPNIVFILTDDLGYADVGFNAKLFGVETDVVTPNIDALAKAGTIFKQAYVSHPFCGPSRMALLTGRMPHIYGGQKNLPDVAKNLEDYNSKGIPKNETLISTVLKNSGYATACVGKWHVGSSKPFHPNTRGFDEFYGFVGGGHQYYPSTTDKVEPKINDYQYFLERNGKDIMSPEGAYLTDTLSDEAVDFIAKKSTKSKIPFFLYLAYNAPHSPLHGKTEDLKFLYPDHKPSDPKNGVNFRDYDGRQNYVAMVYAVDRGLKRIVDTLKARSIMDNTLIVFLSDNGGKILQAANNVPLQDDKGSTCEGGIRVPMFMHWPKNVPSGKVFDHPITALDFYPTLTALAGGKIPVDKKIDGKNIWPDFLAGNNPHPNDPIFWIRHHGGGNEVAIRKGNLKAYRKQFSAWKVFDVTTDFGEEKNLAKENAAVLNEMISAGREWSDTLQEPQWHDTAAGLKSWIDNEMPKYAKTFAPR